MRFAIISEGMVTNIIVSEIPFAKFIGAIPLMENDIETGIGSTYEKGIFKTIIDYGNGIIKTIEHPSYQKKKPTTIEEQFEELKYQIVLQEQALNYLIMGGDE